MEKAVLLAMIYGHSGRLLMQLLDVKDWSYRLGSRDFSGDYCNNKLNDNNYEFSI